MSASHFGTTYWLDDYFGPYFQPEEGGAIIGSLSGSFAGVASFVGTLGSVASDPGAKGKWLYEVPLARTEAPSAPALPIAAKVARKAAAQRDFVNDDEEALWLLVA
jgi:hypothetical protein